jgi:lysophospholipase L1-like esterase
VSVPLAIALAAIVVGCDSGGSTGTVVKQNINYVALGDSITAGNGASDPSRDYVSIFGSWLKSQATTETTTNLGVSGQTSTQFLTELQTSATVRDAVRNADVITISIGGNDFLPCVSSTNGSFDTTCTQAGVTQFSTDWPQIVSTIRTSIGSRAAILVMTLYNFYPTSNPNYSAADAVVQQANTVLINDSTVASTDRYAVADVYTAFKAGQTCDLTHICSTLDPHPSDSGYQLIASVFEGAYY